MKKIIFGSMIAIAFIFSACTPSPTNQNVSASESILEKTTVTEDTCTSEEPQEGILAFGELNRIQKNIEIAKAYAKKYEGENIISESAVIMSVEIWVLSPQFSKKFKEYLGSDGTVLRTEIDDVTVSEIVLSPESCEFIATLAEPVMFKFCDGMAKEFYSADMQMMQQFNIDIDTVTVEEGSTYRQM